MGDVPIFTATPTPRCFFRLADPAHPVCGELASRMRPGNAMFATEYFCDVHAVATDAPIAEARIYRRVRVQLVVDVCGTNLLPAKAQAEAVARLERAIDAVGGCMNLLSVSSAIGQTAAQARLDDDRRRRGSVGEPPLKH